MMKLIKIIEGTQGIKEEGRFLIYNLFTLRNSKMKDALKQFKHCDINEKLLYKDYEDYTSPKSNLPWILIGWGCEDNSTLNRIKRQWLSDIKENKLLNTGYEHKKDPHYYHPLPHLISKRIEYLDHIIPKIDELLKYN